MLSVRGLRRSIVDRVVYEGVSFDVAAGETVVVRGPSGSGKTLLLRALSGLDPVESGSVSLDGRGPEAWGHACWRAEVLWVPQTPPLLPGSPRDLVAEVGSFATQRGRAATDPVTIAGEWGLPSAAWDQDWSELSGGEKQRALLALAVSRAPRVLLLDEPTSALDPVATLAVETTLQALTSVWVTHDEAQAARVGDRMVLLP